VDMISNVLNQICERNDQFISSINITPLTRFHALQAPRITIKSYLKRIAEKCDCSEGCLVVALIYIDRLILTNRCFLVNSLSIHRVIITSIMLAVKFCDELFFTKPYYSDVMLVSIKELNMLEIDFLFRINFDLGIETSLYDAYNERFIFLSLNDDNSMNSRKVIELDRYQEGKLGEDANAPKPSREAPVLQPQEIKQDTDQQLYNETQQVQVQPNMAIEQSMSHLSLTTAAYNQNQYESGLSRTRNSTMKDPLDDY